MKKIDGKTKLVGLFGYPVEHSFSPLMHNSSFEHLNLNYAYLPFAVDPKNLHEAVDGIKALGLKGVNVTIPHKETVIPFLDEIAPAAKLIGAVNTIVHKDGRLVGYNTDGPGFIQSLEEECEIKVAGKSLLIVGAGGAAKAVVVQSILEGAKKIIVANRDLAKAQWVNSAVEQSGKNCSVEIYSLDNPLWKDKVEETDILINTSPVGMYPKIDVPSIVPPEIIHPNLLVGDLIYNPRETVLLQAAKEKRANVWSGLGMLIHQGALAFELWTGVKAPIAVMKGAVENFLQTK